MGLGWVPGDREPYGGNALVGAAIGISVVLVLFVAARFWTRFMQRVKIGLDDYLILLALVWNIDFVWRKVLTFRLGGKSRKMCHLHLPYVFLYTTKDKCSHHIQWPKSLESDIILRKWLRRPKI